jgi:hypothetical protein
MMSLGQAALRYARAGFSVFPVHGIVNGRCTCGSAHDGTEKGKKGKSKPGKHPVTKHGRDDATRELSRISEWWRAYPHANVGLSTGAESGVFVVDLDGEAAEAAWAALEAQHGKAPRTVEQLTGRGRHLLFRWAEGVRNSASKLGPGVDVRGRGGYIVVAPSAHVSGRSYAWAPGRAPGDVDLADAPAWLLELVRPKDRPAVAAPAPTRPREGRATPYGEKALDNACRDLASARPGTQNDTLWIKAIAIGRLCAGGEIHERSYALQALRRAGETMVANAGNRWSDREEDTLERGFKVGLGDPRSAPELARPRSAVAPAAVSTPVTPGERAMALQDAKALWATAQTADCKAFRTWLTVRGLEPDGLPGALAQLRAHREAPLGRGKVGPAVLAPLTRSPGDPVEAVAILPLFEGAQRFTNRLGEVEGRVAVLAWPDMPKGERQVLVAMDLQDAWALGQAAFESGDPMAIVIAPSLRTFAGAPLGDRYGRVDPDMPLADPEQAPWRAAGMDGVYLAVREDLRTPDLRARGALGGTRGVEMEGPAAARFYGALAAQAWRAVLPEELQANAVRVLRPSPGAAGFNVHDREGGAA